MAEKLLAILIILVMTVVGCGMLAGRTVQKTPLSPEYALVQPDNSEIRALGLEAAGLQAADAVTQPVTVTLAVPVSVTLFPPVEDDRDERAQVIWRLTFVVALGLIMCFLVAAVGISLSINSVHLSKVDLMKNKETKNAGTSSTNPGCNRQNLH